MESCDVLIIGGGPAGSSCARRLREAGLNVLVMDKQSFPRDKPCAGWITPQVVEALRLDPEHYRRQRVWQPITGFCSGVIGGPEVQVPYGRTISYGIRRCEFDEYLLQRSGARCRLGQAVRQITRQRDGWLVDGEVSARALVGAGGNFCPVARFLGAARKEPVSVVGAQEVEFQVPDGQADRIRVAPEVPELFFCEDLQGYGWCFRKGNVLNIGLGRVSPKQLSADVKRFCDFLRQRGKVQCDVPSRFVGHAYRLYQRTQPKIVDDGVLLIGDAAGLAYPQSGEGIRPAVESGMLAADAIINSKTGYRVEELAPYQQQIIARFGKARGRSVTDCLPAAWLRYLGTQLLATRWFSRHVVMDRWFLHRRQPALVPRQFG